MASVKGKTAKTSGEREGEVKYMRIASAMRRVRQHEREIAKELERVKGWVNGKGEEENCIIVDEVPVGDKTIDDICERSGYEESYDRNCGGYMVEKVVRSNLWVLGDEVEILDKVTYQKQKSDKEQWRVKGKIVKMTGKGVVIRVVNEAGLVEEHERRYENVANVLVEVSPHEGIYDSLYED